MLMRDEDRLRHPLGDALHGGVRANHRGKDEDVIAHADAPIVPPVSPKGLRAVPCVRCSDVRSVWETLVTIIISPSRNACVPAASCHIWGQG